MHNLATIGTSAITQQFLEAALLTGRFRLHACYSRSADQAAAFASQFGFRRTYTDLQAMAADPDVDAVYIASPNALHESQSRLFLEHGKHVLCEKPIATSEAAYLELLDLANRRGLIYMEAIISRHAPGRQALREAVRKIGTVTQARIDFCQRSSRYDLALAGEQVNIFDMSLAAGTLMDLGVYCVYGALDLFGPPLDVKASAVYLPNGADLAGSALLTYPGFLATLSYSKAGLGACGTEIIGDRGVVRVGSISMCGDVRLVLDGVETTLAPMPSRNEAMGSEAIRFADYIEADCGSYAEVCRLAAQVHRTMDQIKASADIHYP